MNQADKKVKKLKHFAGRVKELEQELIRSHAKNLELAEIIDEQGIKICRLVLDKTDALMQELKRAIETWMPVSEEEAVKKVEALLADTEFPFTPGHVFVDSGIICAVAGNAPLAKMVRDERATKAGISPAERDANAKRFAYCWNKVLEIERGKTE